MISQNNTSIFHNKTVKVLLRDNVVRTGIFVYETPDCIYLFEDNSTEKDGLNLKVTMIPGINILTISLSSLDYTREDFLKMVNLRFGTDLK